VQPEGQGDPVRYWISLQHRPHTMTVRKPSYR
jgi:hypothetical protein